MNYRALQHVLTGWQDFKVSTVLAVVADALWSNMASSLFNGRHSNRNG